MKNTTIAGIRISDYLLQGRDNATGLKALQTVTGIDGRTIRRAIEAERREGVPILSDNKNGYYLPASQEDTERFIQSMKQRAGEIVKTAATVEAAAGQEGRGLYDTI